jgi:hypothetical protein
MNVDINWLAVVLATLSSMVIGWIWYNKAGFGDIWLKLSKVNPKKFNTPLAMGSAVVSSFLLAWSLAYATFVFHSFFHHSYLNDAMLTGIFVFVGFQGLRMFQRAQFNQDSHIESAIHIGNEFVIVIVMTLIIGLIGI